MSDPMDYSPLGSTLHGISQARILVIEMGCHFFLQGIFSTQGSNLRLLHLRRWHWRAGSLPLVLPGEPQCTHTQLSLVPCSFRVFCCSGRCVFTFKHASNGLRSQPVSAIFSLKVESNITNIPSPAT